MSQTQHWSLAITPLSPVHLGTGQDYEPTGYVIDSGALYAFDGIAALAALPAAERARLERILSGHPTQDMLRSVQRFFHDNRESLIPVSSTQVRVNATVEAFYGERVGSVVQHEQGGGRVQNKLEIQRTAYNPPTGRPIVPGSGVKGAIRTALLDQLNGGEPLPAHLRGDRRANQRLQEDLFRYQMRELERDPLRLVRLADAPLADGQALATEVRFAVNRKKHPVMRNDVLLQSRAEQQNLYQLLECLPGMQPRAFRGALTIQGDQGVASRKWPELRFRLPEIAAACNAFYRRALERELETLRQRGYLDAAWDQRLTTLLDGPIGEALAQQRAFLLRVGRHSGAESVTLEGLRSIRIMKGRGEQPEYLDAAKTVWLASDERQAHRGLLPFGWLLVEPFADPTELTPWPDAVRDDEVRRWREAVESRRLNLWAEAERAARLAKLSDEARKIEAVRALLARDRAAGRKEAGGELANALVQLLKEAQESWAGPDCTALADLALEVYGFIGWPASKKKRERQAQIEAIRAKAG